MQNCKNSGILFTLNWFRTFPVYYFIAHSDQRNLIDMDFSVWSRIYKLTGMGKLSLLNWLLTYKAEFRNLIMHRLRYPTKTRKAQIHYYLTRLLWKPLDSLYLETLDIGGGFFILHGFSTIVGAERIGENCWVSQQVTVGYNEKGAPILEDDVIIYCGAKVIGDITMHSNSTAAAGAVVVKDVPPNSTVGGVPAKVIHIE